MSITSATSRTRSLDFSTSSMKVGIRVTGRLSRQKKPSSSRARTAVDFPEPDRPVMISIRILLHLVSEGSDIQAGQELLVKLPGGVVAHPLEKEISGRHLNDGSEVAAGAYRNFQVGEVDPLGDDKTGNRKAAQLADVLDCLVLIELPQVGYFRISQHLEPVGMEVLRIAGQGKPRFLYPRAVNPVGNPLFSGNQFEIEAVLFVLQEVFNGKADGVQ